MYAGDKTVVSFIVCYLKRSSQNEKYGRTKLDKSTYWTISYRDQIVRLFEVKLAEQGSRRTTFDKSAYQTASYKNRDRSIVYYPKQSLQNEEAGKRRSISRWIELATRSKLSVTSLDCRLLDFALIVRVMINRRNCVKVRATWAKRVNNT